MSDTFKLNHKDKKNHHENEAHYTVSVPDGFAKGEQFKLQPTKEQWSILQELFNPRSLDVKYGVICAARGFGKSYLAGLAALMAVQELMLLPEKMLNKEVVIVGPVASQAAAIYVPLMRSLGIRALSHKYSEAMGVYHFPRNVTLYFMSYKSIEKVRGMGPYLVIADEVTSWEKIGNMDLREAWESVITQSITSRWGDRQLYYKNIEHGLPKYETIQTYHGPQKIFIPACRPGKALMISTPKGYDTFYDLHSRAGFSDSYFNRTHPYYDGKFLSPHTIAKEKATIDPIEFAREYLASFSDSGATVFGFNRDKHIIEGIDPVKPGEDVHIAIDFNMRVMATCIFVVRDEKIYVLEDLRGAANTEQLIDILIEKYCYKGYGNIYIYPDASGKYGKTSAAFGVSDIQQLEDAELTNHTKAFKDVIYDKKQPGIMDSVNAVNAKLEKADGSIQFFVDYSCKHLIQSFEKTEWVDRDPDTAAIAKGDWEHWTDAMRYAVDQLFPVRDKQRAYSQIILG